MLTASAPGMSRSPTTRTGVRHNRPMDPKEDPLSRDMRVERVRREDGRALLLYTWPERSDAAVSTPAVAGTPADPAAPDPGRADV